MGVLHTDPFCTTLVIDSIGVCEFEPIFLYIDFISVKWGIDYHTVCSGNCNSESIVIIT